MQLVGRTGDVFVFGNEMSWDFESELSQISIGIIAELVSRGYVPNNGSSEFGWAQWLYDDVTELGSATSWAPL